MKKLLFLLTFSLPLHANTFRLLDTPSRFVLKITSKELIYKSEGINKYIALKACSLPLAKKINEDVLAAFVQSVAEQGMTFEVDGKVHKVQGKLEGMIHLMDTMILNFVLEERKVCK